MTQPNYPKRLIEVDLPIKRISAHARREKSIRHGHISTLHIWWARRPLAACRAVICAALWPDPADPLCPQSFRDRAAELITAFAKQAATDKELANSCAPDTWEKWQALAKPENRLDPAKESHQNILRNALLDFIADFANWDNSTSEAYLKTSRALTESAHIALGGEPGTRPLVVDPFAGGGAIPLEALRVGADAFASDLNPVAVLLNKVVLEYIPKYGQRLADEVRKWGAWIKQEAEKELAEFYPKDPDGATPIAYLWARTIICEGPGCGAEVPLVRNLWLCKKSIRPIALQLIPNLIARRIDFQIIVKQRDGWVDQANPNYKIDSPKFEGTVKRGAATCLCCGYTTSAERVRTQFKGKNGGADSATLLAVALIASAQTGRQYRLSNKNDYQAFASAKAQLTKLKQQHRGHQTLVPEEELPYLRSIFNIQLLDVTQWGQLFSSRQLLVMVVLARLIREAGQKLGKLEDRGLATAVQTMLALILGKQADLGNSLCAWEPNAECPRHLFGRQAIGIVWDFAEGVVTSDSSGGWGVHVERLEHVLKSLLSDWKIGDVAQASATKHPLADDSVQAVITDPPYYDAVPYADLSDFFYVWLKRALSDVHKELFSEELSPKQEEAVQLAERNPKYAYKTKQHFETQMLKALSEARRVTHPQGLSVIVFAHKTTNAWETMLNAVTDSGWVVKASWPIDTEMSTRLRAQDSAVLASSVHLVCRPRENADGSLRDDDIGDWRDVLQELPRRIHEWMPRLAAEGVVGADAIFACLGPALEVFSRYARVEKASGETVTLREYLEHVWAAVAKEALQMIFSEADATGFEEDARLTAMWFWTLNTRDEGGGMRDEGDEEADKTDEVEDTETTGKAAKVKGYALEYDAARKIAQGLGAHLEQLDTIVEVKGDKARLLSVAERARHLFGKQAGQDLDAAPARKKKAPQKELFDMQTFEVEDGGAAVRLQAGRTALDRVHQAMLLFSAGRSEALKRFLVEDGVGRDQRFWSLAQALNQLYPAGTDERRWVEGVLARKKGLGF